MSPVLRAPSAFLLTITFGIDNLSSQCTFDWSDFVLPGTDFSVSAMVVLDYGTGPALYVGGGFTQVGNVSAHHVAKWDGSSWSSIGSQLVGNFEALAVFDDDGLGPHGPALYVGGDSFTGIQPPTNVARWDGTSWTALPPAPASYFYALAALNEGSGWGLYAGGSFYPPLQPSYGVARWDGTDWIPLDQGLNDTVLCLFAFDEGFGPGIYAGTNGFAPTGPGVYRWYPSPANHWSLLGGSPFGGAILALGGFDDGTGPALYAGGTFTGAGLNHIARYHNGAWQPVGAGLDGWVLGITGFDEDGPGPAAPVLYAVGTFTQVGGVAANGIARWDGVNWAPVGAGFSPVGNYGAGAQTVLGFDPDGEGPALAKLYVGGSFSSSGTVAATNIAWWNSDSPGNGSWEPLSTGGGADQPVACLLTTTEATQQALYVGGSFSIIGGITAHGIARFDGTNWFPLGSGVGGGLPSSILTMAADPSDSTTIFAGGMFPTIGGVTANGIAKWNGTEWSALSSGVAGGPYVSVDALQVFDSGDGPVLYAGGNFSSIGGISANHIAKWDGLGWLPLGIGVQGTVSSMAVFDEDGNGPAPAVLFVGGQFSSAGGLGASNIARWDGQLWSAVGSANIGGVKAMAVFDEDGGGQLQPALFVAGSITTSAGTDGIARWDGTSWAAVNTAPLAPTALAVLDAGNGPALYAAGASFNAGFGSVGIAQWNGNNWLPLGLGLSWSQGSAPAPPWAVAGFVQNDVPRLYVGGNFTGAGGQFSSHIASWQASGAAPVITLQPSSITAANGTYAQMHATALGDGPLIYEWRHNGGPIQGTPYLYASGGTLSFNPVIPPHAGGYTVIVSNSCGSVVSNPATLTVNMLPTLITAAQPPAPANNPYQPGQPFRDVLDTGSGPTVTAGIGASGASQGGIIYSHIDLTFTPGLWPPASASNVQIACTGGDCPTLNWIQSYGQNSYTLSLSHAIPPGECTTISFAGTAADHPLHYQSLPGDVDLNGTTNVQDVVALIQALNNGTANQFANLARYNINRSTGLNRVNTQDVLRLVQLLNGLQTIQAFNGVSVAECP